MRTSIRQGAAALSIGVALSLWAGAAQAEAPSARSAAYQRRVTAPKLPAVCPNATLTPTTSNLAVINRATICLVNKERVTRGLVALAENTRLDRAAVRHSRDMVADDFFNDVGPGSQTVEQRTLASGYDRAGSRHRVGENIAIGTIGADTPAQTVATWMNQPAHRAVILRPVYRETGVGAVAAIPSRYLGGKPGATYTQTFGVIGAT